MDTRCQIPRRKPLQAKIGLMAVGHHVYWPQFPGLREEMERKKQVLAQKIRQTGVELIDFGMADEAISAANIARDIEEQHIDLLFIHMATYATSATIAPVFRLRHLPMVMVALQPLEVLDYANATTFMQLCNDDVCAMPEFAGIAIRMGRRVPELIIGTENDTQADQEIVDYCAIARALHDLRHARIGHMG
ncbi:MAG: arabinose isomerase, partial [Lentisphaerae bacterium]